MNKKILGLSFVALCGVVSIGAAIGIYNNYSGVEKIVAEDKTNTDYKRIYAVLADVNWTHSSEDGDLWLYYTSSSTSVDWATAPKMTLIGNSNSSSDTTFRYGLYYVDIPADASMIIFKNFDGNGDEWRQTEDVYVYTESEYEMFYINEVVSGKRTVTTGTCNLSSEYLAQLLTIYNTCDPSILDGYNAYQQIYDIFLSGNNNYDRSTVVYEVENITYTIGDIIDAMKARYDAQDRYA